MSKKAATAIQKFRGKRRVSQLWYTPAEYELVQRAAQIERRPMTVFAIVAAIKAAKEVLRTQTPKKGD